MRLPRQQLSVQADKRCLYASDHLSRLSFEDVREVWMHINEPANLDHGMARRAASGVSPSPDS